MTAFAFLVAGSHPCLLNKHTHAHTHTHTHTRARACAYALSLILRSSQQALLTANDINLSAFNATIILAQTTTQQVIDCLLSTLSSLNDLSLYLSLSLSSLHYLLLKLQSTPAWFKILLPYS